VNTIIFDYRTNTYHVQRDGQPTEVVKMSPRAAAHIAVILAAAGWDIRHVGLIPHPVPNQFELLTDLEALTIGGTDLSPYRAPDPEEHHAPAEAAPPVEKRGKPAKPSLSPDSLRMIEFAAKKGTVRFTAKQVAELLNMRYVTLQYHIRNKNLPAQRQRENKARYAIHPSDLLKFVSKYYQTEVTQP
jgi:hypothetical protein